MNHVAIMLRHHGTVVEERVCRLCDGLVLGDASGAVVSFPGVALTIRRDRRGWTVGGHRLVPGRNLVLSFGAFEVSLEFSREDPSTRLWEVLPEPGLLIATLAAALMALAVEAAGATLDDNPELRAGLRAIVLGVPLDAPPSLPADATPARTTDAWPEPVSVQFD